jgi:hypothetical protein
VVSAIDESVIWLVDGGFNHLPWCKFKAILILIADKHAVVNLYQNTFVRHVLQFDYGNRKRQFGVTCDQSSTYSATQNHYDYWPLSYRAWHLFSYVQRNYA